MSESRVWHCLSTDDVSQELAVDLTFGLSEEHAAGRLTEHGPNELQAAERGSGWTIFAEQFQDVLIVILLLATVLSAILGHGIEALAIGIIVLFAVLLGFAQEYRAERAIQALRQMAAPLATVLREGRESSMPARDLVPGDVIILRTGDKIPADARLFEAVNLRLDEAVLTGESLPVEKQTARLDRQDSALGDRTNMAYAGTAATYGRGRAVVVATGMQTEFGQIAQLLETVETGKTPLQVNLDRVGRTLAKAAVVIVLVIVGFGLWREQPLIEMLIFGIALAVAVVPEALPAVVTISLAIGVQRMVKRHALMRRLSAVETLGSTSVICSDKTGTLTKDEMTVRQVFVAGRMQEVSGAGYEPVGQFSFNGSVDEPCCTLKRLLQAATLASDARLVRSDSEGLCGLSWDRLPACRNPENTRQAGSLSHEKVTASEGRWLIKGDPTEGALIVAAAKAGFSQADLEARFPRIDEIPFAAETKRMTTLHAGPDGVVAYSKGAPEVILDACVWRATAEGDVTLDDDGREQILDAARQMAGAALRVLAVSAKSNATRDNAESEMSFLGLFGMLDPPRPEAQAAIHTCELAGIKVVMITGDHPLTAQAVGRELGVLKAGRVVTGAELEAMSESELERVVEDIEIYARVSPAHKLRVVAAWQKRGRVVAMTGDGVNDAPALKQADIGIAMGIAGTDVTREAAAMTLTDDNFASIVAAVEEGRGIYENIKKYLMYLLSSNIGEIGLMTGTTLMGLPLPLTAVQILYVNLATDGLPALALAVDPPASDLMQRPPRDARTGIFTRPVVTLMTVGGLWSALVNIGLFAWALKSGRSQSEAMTMTFVSLVLIQFFKAYNFRSDRLSVLHRPFANKWLNLAIVWEVLLLVAIVHVPVLHVPFETYSLTATDWAIVLGLSLTVSPVLELAKWLGRHGWFGRMS